MHKVAILEDNVLRQNEMSRVMPLHNVFPITTFFRTAPGMIQWLQKTDFSSLSALSLDHDLDPVNGLDPGDGLDVARWLAGQTVRIPVLIHSSNADRAQRMEWILNDSGFLAYWSPPSPGTDWIEANWIKQLLKIIETGNQGRQ